MVRELRALADTRPAEAGRHITLSEFLRETGLELGDVYRSGSWSALQRDAGLEVRMPGRHEDLIGDRLSGILHVDDPLRLAAYQRFADAPSVDELSEAERRLVTGFHFAAISSTLFHWESQSTTTQRSMTGQRYIHHRDRGGNILLFVRSRKKQDGRTMPYTFLGPVDYVSHQDERPIKFVWRLRRPMPADFFRQAKVAIA